LNAGHFRCCYRACAVGVDSLRSHGVDTGLGLQLDVLVLVHDDAREQGLVQEPAFSGFATQVQPLQIGEHGEHVFEAFTGVRVAGMQAVEPGLDRAECVLDSVLLALQQIDRDRIGVVRLHELQPFGLEASLLLGECRALVAGPAFEPVEHLVQNLPNPGSLVFGE